MFFSIIVATVDRTHELTHFLRSLERQTQAEFEVIVVDQNPDQRLVPVLTRFQKRFPLLHLQSKRGLSRARNVGLAQARGGVVAFPDDDCWYPPDLLRRVEFAFNNTRWDGILGKLIWKDQAQKSALALPSHHLLDFQPLNLFNATISVDITTVLQALRPKASVPNSSATLFLKRSILVRVGEFDKTLGLGANTSWGGGEEVDLTVRCLKAGSKLAYCPQINVFHPDPKRGYHDLTRGFRYGAGLGRVLRKHDYPFWFVLYHWSRSLGGAGLQFLRGNRGKSRYQWEEFRGKITGWINGKPPKGVNP